MAKPTQQACFTPVIKPAKSRDATANGAEIFVEKFGEILNVSRDGEVETRELLHAYLRCMERDDHGVIVIDPRVSFGRPVLDGTGIRTEIVVDRFRAGEPIDSLVQDYGRSREEIEVVVRSELAGGVADNSRREITLMKELHAQ